jgi:DNA-binding CsgD family transcriptional regulator
MGLLETPHLIGRTQEVARLSEAVREARQRAVLVVMQGLPGVGKTSLLTKVSREASSAGFDVRRAGSSPDGSSQPFAPLLDALNLDGSGMARRRAQQLLASSVDNSAQLFALAADRRWQAIDALCEVVAADAQRGPLLLSIDDLHWAEASAVIALRSFRQRLHDLPILIVVTSRPISEGELAASLQALEDDADGVIELHRLTEPQAEQLAAQCLGEALTSEQRAVFEGTNGNPLLIHQFAYDVRTLESCESTGQLGGAADLPIALSEPLPQERSGIAQMALAIDGLLARRVKHLEPNVLRIAKVAATIGNIVKPQHLMAAAVVDADVLSSAVVALRNVGLLQPENDSKELRFAHDLLRDGLYRTCTDEERSEMHGRVADVLVGSGAAAGAIAWHLREQPNSKGPDRRRWLLQAAEEASGSSPGLAARLLEEALLGVSPSDGAFRAEFIALVGHLASAGRVGDSEQLSFALLQHDLAPEEELTLRWWLASVLFAQGRLTEGLEIAQVGWRQARDPVTRARMSALVCLIQLLLLDPKFLATLPLAQQAVLDADDPSATTIVYSLASREAINRLDFEEGLRFAKAAVNAADGDPTGIAHRYQPIFFLALVMLDLVDKPALGKYLALGRRRAEQTGTAWSNALFLSIGAVVAQRDGRFDDAVADARAAIATAEESGIYIGVVFAHAVCASVFVFRGDFDAAREAISDGKRILARDPLQFGSDILSIAEVELRIAEGDVEGGLFFAVEVAEFYFSIGFCTAMQGAFQPILFYGHLLSREPLSKLHKRVLPLLHSDAQLGPLGTSFLEPTRAVIRAQQVGTADSWHEAIRLLDKEGWGLHCALVRAAAAGALAMANNASAAQEYAADADERLKKVTAFAERHRLASLLGPRRERKNSGIVLSRTERTVAGLVAEGLSNRAIAEQTGQSVRTVEAHVSSILRKLGVTSRARVASIFRG